MAELTGYDLSREWFDYCFENPEKINTNQTALYFFIIEHCNRLGWKKKFGLPTTMAMEALGISSYNTYKKTLNALIENGFITMIEVSKNQYSSNIVALSKNDKALDKALDKAFIKHGIKQGESTEQSSDSIDKQLTINKEVPPLPKINNSREQKLLEMFTSVTMGMGYEQEFLKIEVNKFLNKYSNCIASRAGVLVNSWAANLNKQEQEQWKQSCTNQSVNITSYQKQKEEKERERLKELQ